jgi:putative hemolysin
VLLVWSAAGTGRCGPGPGSYRTLVGWFGGRGSARSVETDICRSGTGTLSRQQIGELAPKRIAMQRAERWTLLVAYPLDMLAAICRPAVQLLGAATNLAVQVFGGDPRPRAEVTTEEFRDMIAAQAGFNAQQRTITGGAFDIADRMLREIVVPRRNVLTLPGALASQPARQASRGLRPRHDDDRCYFSPVPGFPPMDS